MCQLLLRGPYRRLFASAVFACGLVGAETALAAIPYAFTQAATGITGDKAVLNGVATPNGLASLVWFEWGTETNYANRTANTSAGDGGAVVFVTNQIAGLQPCIPYHFRVAVTNSLGVAYGADQVFAVGRKVWAWGNNDTGQTNVPTGLTNAVVAVAGGGDFSLALKTNGTVVGWGQYYNGSSYVNMTIPAGLTGVAAIAAGGDHSLALKSDGTVVAWGNNTYGQASVPSGLNNVVAIAGGFNHSLALKGDGTVVYWGRRVLGTVPEGLTNIVAIAAGRDHSLALRSDGAVLAWGNWDYGLTNIPEGLTGVVSIACGDNHNLALKSDGTIVGWGYNYSGQTIAPAGLSNAEAIAAGGNRSFAITREGAVMAWGYPGWGLTNIPGGLANAVCISGGHWFHQLALAANQRPIARAQTVFIAPIADIIVSLSATDGDSDKLLYKITALPTLGTLYQYSGGTRGAIISSTNTLVSDSGVRVIFVPPTVLTGVPFAAFQFIANDGFVDSLPTSVIANFGPNSVTQPATVIRGASAILNGMAVPNNLASTGWFEWGRTTAYGNQTLPVDLGGGSTIIAVTNQIVALSAGDTYHFRLVISNNAGVAFGRDQFFSTGRCVWFWGFGPQPTGFTNIVALAVGQGHGLMLKNDGALVRWGYSEGLAGLSNIAAIAEGYYHSLALKSDGTVLEWGSGNVPAGLSNVVAIAGGGSHSLALKSNGSVVAWGNNSYRQITVPAGLSNVVGVAAGGSHSLALKIDGTVVAWGLNSYGQTNVPAGLGNVVAIAGGIAHSLVLRGDGTVLAWGSNSDGQTNVPPGLSNVVAIAAGAAHNLALKSDGTVVAWGYNYSGLTNVPSGLSNAVAVSAGYWQSLALGPNHPPFASSQITYGVPNADLSIALLGTDLDGDLLSYKITSLPTLGTLYQFGVSGRGEVISSVNTVVSDPAGRVIFEPASNGYGVPYASFQFLASDGLFDSASAPVSVNIADLPSALTQPVGAPGLTTAVLNGLAGSNPLSGFAWFQWGVNTNYGNQTIGTNIASGNTPVAITSSINGLSPGSTYHCRIVATNNVGTSYGNDVVFTTQSPAISQLGIVSLSASGTNLVFRGTSTGWGTLYLLTSTNAGRPLSQWQAVATNVLSASGDFVLNATNLVKPTVAQQFFALSTTNNLSAPSSISNSNVK